MSRSTRSSAASIRRCRWRTAATAWSLISARTSTGPNRSAWSLATTCARTSPRASSRSAGSSGFTSGRGVAGQLATMNLPDLLDRAMDLRTRAVVAGLGLLQHLSPGQQVGRGHLAVVVVLGPFGADVAAHRVELGPQPLPLDLRADALDQPPRPIAPSLGEEVPLVERMDPASSTVPTAAFAVGGIAVVVVPEILGPGRVPFGVAVRLDRPRGRRGSGSGSGRMNSASNSAATGRMRRPMPRSPRRGEGRGHATCRPGPWKTRRPPRSSTRTTRGRPRPSRPPRWSAVSRDLVNSRSRGKAAEAFGPEPRHGVDQPARCAGFGFSSSRSISRERAWPSSGVPGAIIRTASAAAAASRPEWLSRACASNRIRPGSPDCAAGPKDARALAAETLTNAKGSSRASVSATTASAAAELFGASSPSARRRIVPARHDRRNRAGGLCPSGI